MICKGFQRLGRSLVLCAFTLALPAAGQNLLTNSRFEQGMQGWQMHVRTAPATAKPISDATGTGIHVAAQGSGMLLQSFQVDDPDAVYQITIAYRTAPGGVEGSATTRFAPMAEGNSFLNYLGIRRLRQTYGAWRIETINLRFNGLQAVTCRLEINMSGGFEALFREIKVRKVPPAEAASLERVEGYVPTIERPVFEEVLSDEPSPFDYFPNWDYSHQPGRLRNDSLAFGLENILEDNYAEQHAHGLAPIARGGPAMAEKHDVPLLGFLVSNENLAAGKKASGMALPGRVPLHHPAMEEQLFEEMGKLVRHYGDTLWGIFYMDEPYNWMAAIPKEADRDAYWQQVDREVREDHGFGKYGLPSSRLADEPFNQIAYRRWLDDKLHDLLTRLKAHARELDPDLVLVGVDEYGAATPRDWERLAETWDVTTGQTKNFSGMGAMGQHRVGFHTKFYRDLTRHEDVRPFPQVNRYDQNVNAQYIQASYSQVLRNGGVGYWFNTVEWFDRNLMHPRYSAPDRWQAMLEVSDVVRELPKLDYPEADTALLYSLDTHAAMNTSQAWDREASTAHYFLGPVAGSWFDIISEPQIERGTRDLSRYRVIYIPRGKYMRADVVDALVAYVENGGTLVSTDPEVFSWDDRGGDTSQRREALFGVRDAGEVSDTKLRVHSNAALVPPLGESLPHFGGEPRGVRAVGDEVESLMRFGDGSVAMSVRRVGEGRAIYFAFNPFEMAYSGSAEWREVFTHMQKALGAATDLPIWRFQIPMREDFSEAFAPPAEGVNLTGNHVERRAGVFTPRHNLANGGSYRYRTAPAEEGQDGQPIAFADGLLTNRAKAFAALGVAIRRERQTFEPAQWTISWDSQEQPLVIDLELNAAHRLTALRVVASGEVPAFRLESLDSRGQSGSELASSEGESLGQDVKVYHLPLEGTHQKLRLHFDPVAAQDAPLIISEIELWGHE